MQYADFLTEPTCRRYDWRLTNWSAAVRIALGSSALLCFRSAFAALLAPAVVLASYSFASNRPTLLILVLLSFWGYWTSSTAPTATGLAAGLLIALTGFVCGLVLHDTLVIVSSWLPGITWFGSCAILGTTASYLTDAIRASETLFQSLVSRGILRATPVAEPATPRAPVAEPAANRDSSPRD